MDYSTHECRDLPATVEVSHFHGESGVDEYHLVVRPGVDAGLAGQLDCVEGAYLAALASRGLDRNSAVLRRFFCSDVHNQAETLNACPISRRDPADNCAVSWVGQPPDAPARVMLWACHIRDPHRPLEKSADALGTALKRGNLVHHWTCGLTCPSGENSHEQTRGIFRNYDSRLGQHGMKLADNVIRTWLFVSNIDTDYAGMVAARREFFASRGLTPQTHFIASSGIAGSSCDVTARVMLDAYAIEGLDPRQIRFLSARDHLSPTHVYGVTFERGTSVAYRDREHVIISGTASIDSKGEVLHACDVGLQLDRTLRNIDALLREAGAGCEDVCHFIVYVRDPADHPIVLARMRERFSQVPTVVVTAAVCRPRWLVEVEAMAIIPAANPHLPVF